jgi:DNA invertase Pin-like site-specific DNA recombinase
MRDASAKGRTKGGLPPGEDHPRAKLSDAQILAIRAEYKAGGKSLKEVATPYNVRLQTVWRIVHGHSRV